MDCSRVDAEGVVDSADDDIDDAIDGERPGKAIASIAACAVVLVVLFFISFGIGRYPIPVDQVVSMFAAKVLDISQTWTDEQSVVVFSIRLPRIIAAIMVGAALSVSGAVYQGLFKNPMVSPDILGASAGSGFGAAIAILMGLGTFGIQSGAFLFGLLAVGLTCLVCKLISRGENTILMLVLTGMVVSALFQAFISITKYAADPNDVLPAITFWLMGSLSSVTYNDLAIFTVPFVIGIVPLFLLRWKLNVMSFGEEEARAMGVNTARIRRIVIVCATLLVAGSVAMAGIIGWVGLIIPHLARSIVGPDHRYLLPASMITGAAFLLLVDNVSRGLLAMEVPIGILTAIIGAPFFLIMLVRTRRGGWQ